MVVDDPCAHMKRKDVIALIERSGGHFYRHYGVDMKRKDVIALIERMVESDRIIKEISMLPYGG